MSSIELKRLLDLLNEICQEDLTGEHEGRTFCAACHAEYSYTRAHAGKGPAVVHEGTCIKVWAAQAVENGIQVWILQDFDGQSWGLPSLFASRTAAEDAAREQHGNIQLSVCEREPEQPLVEVMKHGMKVASIYSASVGGLR